MRYSIGRELTKLAQLQDHIEIADNYYKESISNGVNINDIAQNDYNETSIRSFAVQHLLPYQEFEFNDLEDHHLGFGIKILKRDKLVEILRDKPNFYQRVQTKTKQNILSICRQDGYSENTFEGIVSHYFPASRQKLNFEIYIDFVRESILIVDVYFGTKNDNNEERRQRFQNQIGSRI